MIKGEGNIGAEESQKRGKYFPFLRLSEKGKLIMRKEGRHDVRTRASYCCFSSCYFI
jgi:hypothetical protein